MPESPVPAMQAVCDAAHEVCRWWTHQGWCRLCDEAMETLRARLRDLAVVLDQDVARDADG